ncbi:MFS transporter [Bacillus sp. AGMB 02131]|uniref:MFS transporter n=1 Tax=Peribacillus faecalis TaxID=2772559 RepID=A0A927HCE9_9BACI|nr:MFS transporter [Peribacillus faecalis]MBD3109959.1 MFS transporter [Peribacillus faecalis]
MKKSAQSVSKWCLVSIASIPLVMTLGNSMLIPVLPVMEKELDISSTQSSLLITCYSVSSIFLIPIAGFLSDKFGRKNIILPSMLIVFIGGLISGFASWKMSNPYWIIMAGRILQGVGAAGAAPIVLPLVGDLYKSDEEASATLGIIETSNTFGKVISPIFGAAIGAVVWFMPFFLISLFSLISILLVVFFVKQKKISKPVRLRKFIENTKRILRDEGKWLYTLFIVGGFVMLVLFMMQVFLSNHLETQFHMKGVKKGFILAIPLSLLCASSLLSGKYIKGNKMTMKRVTLFGLLMQAAALFLFKEYNSIVLLIMVLSLLGIAIGMILPCLDSLITENVEKSQRGLITSFLSSARFIGVATGPPIATTFVADYFGLSMFASIILTLYMLYLVFKNVQVTG